MVSEKLYMHFTEKSNTAIFIRLFNIVPYILIVRERILFLL